MRLNLSSEVLKDFSKFNNYTGTRRYNAYKVENSDGVYFYKEALTRESKVRLANEVEFNRCVILNKLFRVPEVVDFDGRAALFEWVDAPLVMSEGLSLSVSETQIVKLADSLNCIDRLESVSFKGLAPDFPFPTWSQYLEDWLRKPLQNKLINLAEVEQAKSTFAEFNQYMRPCLQHGDFFGWHLFDTDPVTIFDNEHAGNEFPRFMDLARSFIYTNTYSGFDLAVGSLLKLALSSCELTMEQFAKEVTVPFLIQSVYCLNDSVNDLDIHDVRAEARESFLRAASRSWLEELDA